MITTAPQKHPDVIEPKILQNALEIIHHTGLLKTEVANLCIDDVRQNGRIVSQIQPVSGAYPKGFEKAPVILSVKKQDLIDQHIKFLQASGLSTDPKSPLFPVAKTNKRYDDSKIWNSLSKYCIYNSYERQRQAGIHNLCWELSKNEHDKLQIINTAHQFARYSNIKRTEKLLNELISSDPDEYEIDYRNSLSSAKRLISFQESRSDKVTQHLSDLQLSFNLLFDRDKKTIINNVNKSFEKYSKIISLKDNSLVIEAAETRISAKIIMKRKRKKFN